MVRFLVLVLELTLLVSLHYVGAQEVSDKLVSGQKEKVEVVAEEWTASFPEALECAKKEHKPIVMMLMSAKCTHCIRLRRVLFTESFKKWIAGTGIYLTYAVKEEVKSHPDQAKLSEFIDQLREKQKTYGPPFIGVYWPGTTGNVVRTVFTGQRGTMPTSKEPLLIDEFVNALQNVLEDYFKSCPERPRMAELIEKSGKQVMVLCEGNGSVTISPRSGVVKEDGGHVTLMAKPGPSMMLYGWKDADGKFFPKQKTGNRLYVTSDMANGPITAVFKQR